MPSIELDGHSEATFQLIDGKIVRVPAAPAAQAPAMPEMPSFDARLRRD